jgi:adenylylsulfate kinase
MIVILAGLPGTGKSTLAKALALTTGGAVISKDEVRAALFPVSDIEYSTPQDDFCMEVMLEAAGWLIKKNPSRVVLLDGRTFSRTYQLERVLAWAAQHGQEWRILECVCREDTAKHRIDAQARAGEHVAGNRDAALYDRVRERFEPITLPKTVINTDLPLEQCLRVAQDALPNGWVPDAR